MTKESNEFIIEQLEEALEERQKPDRRQTAAELDQQVADDRRKQDRRNASQALH